MTRLRPLLVLLLLAGVNAAAFRGVGRNEFIKLDDPAYVTENQNVRAGITGQGVRWALTTTHAANWHPVTWLSHMLDVQLFGLSPGAHHLANLFWHTANTLLLFLLIRGLTGALWRSAFVAALFAVHPLHVESVAWVAERKDVLSAFLWLATSLAYLRYARTGRAAAYAAVLVLFALGLMAKPMLVTLPLTLLLLDYWPLGRLVQRESAGSQAIGRSRGPVRVVAEKLPLLAMAAASSVVTLRAQQAGSMVRSLSVYPLGVRVENALFSYLRYLGKTLWPAGLAVPYAHPGDSLTFVEVGGAAVVVLGATALAFRLRRRRPYAAIGWLWFLGTLVPVIGLVQISDQAMADRYTYLPLVGLFVALVWGAADLIARWPRRPAIVGAVSCCLLAALVAMTGRQVDHWRDNVSLFRNTARVTREHNLAHLSMELRGKEMAESGMSMAAVEIRMGDEMARHRKFEEAAAHYRTSLKLDPEQVTAHARLGALFLHLGRADEAAVHYAEVMKMRPNDSMARADLGLALRMQGKVGDARRQFSEALRLDPANQKAIANLRELR